MFSKAHDAFAACIAAEDVTGALRHLYTAVENTFLEATNIPLGRHKAGSGRGSLPRFRSVQSCAPTIPMSGTRDSENNLMDCSGDSTSSLGAALGKQLRRLTECGRLNQLDPQGHRLRSLWAKTLSCMPAGIVVDPTVAVSPTVIRHHHQLVSALLLKETSRLKTARVSAARARYDKCPQRIHRVLRPLVEEHEYILDDGNTN
eukprot:8706213-Heterocapsa_arctica.AAC.1